MAGSSIVASGAAGWVADFIDAAFFARPEDERELADLRLAHGVIATRWASHQDHRLGVRDVLALKRAYGKLRLPGGGRLDRAALLAGGVRLLGDWFPGAWADDERRAHGIAFETVTLRRRFEPEQRLQHVALGSLAPPSAAPADQHWAAYDPVPLPDPEAALGLIRRPARWPDISSEIGRFTALRGTGLPGQTFELELVTRPSTPTAAFARGYVTCTESHVSGDGQGDLDTAVAGLAERYAAGGGADPLLPAGAEPLALVVLTTHEGHVLGRARSHLLVWRDTHGACIRAIEVRDTADPVTQGELWAPAPAQRSVLAQLALVSAG